MFATPHKHHATLQPTAAPTFFGRAGQAEAGFFSAKREASFFAPTVQPRLEVSHPEDPQEREAEAIADHVMSESSSAATVARATSPRVARVQRLAGAGGFASHGRADDEPTTAVQAKLQAAPRSSSLPLPQAALTLQRARGPPQAASGPPSFEKRLASSKGGGSALPDDTRHFMEGRFGADFSQVRVHHGADAAQLSRSISAQAFTHGSDIFFNSGKYSPGTSSGQHLLAHELAHTVQQGGSPADSGGPAARSLQRRPSQVVVNRVSEDSQREAALALAHNERGRVSADRAGPDGKRVGWQRLLEYFKTSLGDDRVLPEAAAQRPGMINETQIIRTLPAGLPSWSGIFAYWALKRAGVPLQRWQLSGYTIPAQAAYPAAHAPQPGDIAYRRDAALYALVSSSDASTVTSIHGDTSVEDGATGEIALQTHSRQYWQAYFDPSALTEGSQRAELAAAPTRSLSELRQQVFGIQRNAGSAKVAEPKPVDVQAEEQEQESGSATTGTTALQRAAAGGKQPLLSPAAPALARSVLPRTAAASSAAAPVRGQPETAPLRTLSEVRNRGPPLLAATLEAERVQCSWLDDAWSSVRSVASGAADAVARGLDAATEWLLARVRDFVSNIPGYRMLCLTLGRDPITDELTPLTGAALLDAGLDILPLGALFGGVLQRLGIYPQVAAWLGERIDEVRTAARGISSGFDRIWRGVTLEQAANPDALMQRVADLLSGALDAMTAWIERAGREMLVWIRRVMLPEIANFVRERIPHLYPLLTVALGFDPQTLEAIERNGTNILAALLEVSEDGREQRAQLEETGTFARIAAWIDRGIGVFTRAYSLLQVAIDNIWDFVTIEDLFSPLQTLTRIWNEISEPVRIVGQFLIDAGIEILSVIKTALLARLSEYAQETQGFSLICVLIGRDPFTDEVVPRTVHNIVRGFMGLMEGGEQQYQELSESGAIDRIIDRVEAAVARLNMTPAAVVQLFSDLWDSFTIQSLANPIQAFERIVAQFGEPILRLILFVIEILMIVIEAILILMSFPFDLIANIISNARQAHQLIQRDPAGFLKNLLRAIKQGFTQFFDHILPHLLDGVVGWLMAELRDANVPEPRDFSLQGVIGWVLQVLGISMDRVWEILAAHPRIGQARVAQIRSMIETLEGIWTFIRDVQERGIEAIWERIQEQLSNLWQTVIDSVKNWIVERIVNAVVARLLSMLDPTGIMAVVNSVLALYRSIQSFIRYLTEMLQVVNSFVEGVVAVASGVLAPAADALEGALARAMPVVIGFLANQIGLSGVGHRIAEMIEVVRGLVDRALTWLVNRAVDTGFALFDRLMSFGQSAVEAVTNWWNDETPFTGADGTQHKVYFEGNEEDSELFVQSRRTNAQSYIEEYRRGLVEEQLNDQVETASGQVTTRRQAIADATRLVARFQTEKRRRIVGETDELQNESRRLKNETIQRTLNELADVSAPLFGESRPAFSEMTLPDMIDGYQGYGTTMIASKFYKCPAVLARGSAPTRARHPLYSEIDFRQSGDGSYYVRGHMLNQLLGGPGTWNNMVPLTRSANNRHESDVERPIKQAFDDGDVIDYSVEARGAQYLIAPPPSQKARFTGISDIDRRFARVQSVIQGESSVPAELVCNASTMRYLNGQWVPHTVLVNGVRVPNDVDTAYSSYQLSDEI